MEIEMLSKVKEVSEAQEKMKEQLDTIKCHQLEINKSVKKLKSDVGNIQCTVENIEGEVDSHEVLKKIKEVRAAQEELEGQLYNIKFSQSDMKENTEKLQSQ
ncbi:uncharacterized protein LOC144630469 [Oculina patagonica]